MNYTLEFKKSIVEKYQQQISVTEISREYEIPRSTIYNWIDLHIERDLTDFKTSKQKILNDKAKLTRFKNENEISYYVLSKLKISKRKKLEFVYLLSEMEYPVKAICRVLDIDTSSYYHDKNRKPNQTLVELDDEKFRPLIKSVFDESDGRFGGRKIKIILKRKGHTISHSRVVRLMKEMNLKPNQPDDNYNNYHKRKYSYKPNIISKSEYYPEPNKVWVSDITYLKIQKQHFYLFVIIDLYSRKIIGYNLSKTLEPTILVELIDITYNERNNPENLIFHSDQGLQYRSKEFKAYLRNNQITQSFSKKACPYDNAVAESFFASLKKEEVYRHIYNSFEELEKAIDKYIIFYNTLRPHASLKYKTPDEYENTSK